MKHARLVCNQREKYQCAECRRLTSNGYQLIDTDETKFVCKDCYVNVRLKYPAMGECINHLLDADVVFSDDYDPNEVTVVESLVEEGESNGYVGELVPDGNGGWRVPTPDEIAAMNSQRATEPDMAPTHTHPADDFNMVNIRYRFTTDNKLQVILPKRCRLDDRAYELIVTTEE